MTRIVLAIGMTLVGVDAAWAQRVNSGGGVPAGNASIRPGTYNPVGNSGLHQNPTTGSVYAPGVGVIKSSGVYTPLGNGYYQNATTGNVYNPNTGTYIQRR